MIRYMMWRVWAITHIRKLYDLAWNEKFSRDPYFYTLIGDDT